MNWPDVQELKALLDVDGSDWDEHLNGLMAAGIAKVKADVGDWDDDTDEPDEALQKAALRAAVLMRPNASEGLKALRSDEVYQTAMFGKRRKFGIA